MLSRIRDRLASPAANRLLLIILGVALAALFALGAFLGKVGKTSLIVSGLKMIGAGLTAIVLSYLLEH